MLKGEGKNPFILDSREPTKPFKEFIQGEVRYSSLMNVFPDIAEKCRIWLNNMLVKDTTTIGI